MHVTCSLYLMEIQEQTCLKLFLMVLQKFLRVDLRNWMLLQKL